MPQQRTSYIALETLFLDAGNTLISMDYGWIARELGAHGLETDAADIARAEAAARPATSKHVAQGRDQSSRGAFEYYLARILDGLPVVAALDSDRRAELVREVAIAVKRPGEDHRLWSRVLPGVPEALADLRDLGLDLIVVSNSDGSVEQALDELGLARYLTEVLDSAIVGFEKPDARFFEHALERSGARREHTLHVGDMYYQDVVGARAAGVDVVLLDPYDDWHAVDCVTCRDLSELVARISAARSKA